jgi:hypothetical protein
MMIFSGLHHIIMFAAVAVFYAGKLGAQNVLHDFGRLLLDYASIQRQGPPYVGGNASTADNAGISVVREDGVYRNITVVGNFGSNKEYLKMFPRTILSSENRSQFRQHNQQMLRLYNGGGQQAQVQLQVQTQPQPQPQK